MYPITHENKDYMPGEAGTPSPAQPITCDLCGAVCTPTSAITPGYACLDDIDGHRSRLCYKCAADFERSAMIQTGHACLYLDENKRTVSNWTGDLSFPAACIWHGRHNFWACPTVTFTRFIGPDGAVWTGRLLGDMQLIRCKRTKIEPRNIRQ